ncbi:MAG: PfkB family carbohydrate kinase [Patescibacteria group bacterium]
MLVDMPELTDVTRSLKGEGKRLIHCHGVFDLLHPGHIKHLQAAKRLGDVLVVTITQDKYVNRGPGRPVFNQELRAESVNALACVDLVAVNQWPTAVEIIKAIKPDVYVKGSEYSRAEEDLTGRITDEEEAVSAVGGKVHFTDEITFSSTNLINQFFNPYPAAAQEFLAIFREKYSARDIIEKLKALERLKVLVVGDTIIDEYCYCRGMGKPPKDNVISARYLSEERFAGGVLAAANHIAGFCARVEMVTCLGWEDHRAQQEFLANHLKPNIGVKYFYQQGALTTVKRRFIDPAFFTKMFELAYLYDSPPRELRDALLDYLTGAVRSWDLVLVTDFGHGLIDQEIANVLTGAKFLAVNAQTNSANAGFNLITKYRRGHYVCLDEPELRLACQDRTNDVKSLARTVAVKLDSPLVAVTQGHQGSLCYNGDFHQTPALSTKVVDRTGAGDAFLSITAPCARLGYPMDLIGFIGNAVGALKVQIVGNKESVEPVPLFKFISTLLK